MRRMPRRSAKRRRGLPCASCRSRARSSRRCWSMHRVRDLLVRQRTQLINALRGHLSEFGLVAARGPGGLRTLVAALAEAFDDELPGLARAALQEIVAAIAALEERLTRIDRAIVAANKESETARRLLTVPVRPH